MNPSQDHPSSAASLAVLLFVAALLPACGADTATTTAAAAPTDVVQLKLGGAELAQLRVESITARDVPRMLDAPGEVKVDDYRSAEVTARVAAEVLQRHARLGEAVRAGQPLVTLSSAEVAEARGEAQLRAQEWQRVRALGEDAVGARRYQEARVAAEQAHAKLLNFGLTDAAAASGAAALGRFTLTAPRAGTVLRDNFVVGEHIEPGHELFYIADESATWVEAHLTPADALGVAIGGAAAVQIDGDWRGATIVQKHHAVDETTRTIAVRIELPMSDDSLHAGQLVACRIQSGMATAALTVPERALYQDADGGWGVFVEQAANHYRRVPVQRVQDLGDRVQVTGIASGARVVVDGAFFLNSELQKSSFADGE